MSNSDPEDVIRLKLYYDVWYYLNMLMRTGGILFYVTGKTLGLNEIGRGKLGNISPGGINRIDLSCFEVSDIKQILTESKNIDKNCTQKVYERLKVPVNDIDKLAVWLHGLTSGIPRLVVYALDFLLTKEHDPITYTYDSQLVNAIFDVLMKAPGCMPPKDLRTNKGLAPALLAFAVTEYEFENGPEVKLPSRYTALELAIK